MRARSSSNRTRIREAIGARLFSRWITPEEIATWLNTYSLSMHRRSATILDKVTMLLAGIHRFYISRPLQFCVPHMAGSPCQAFAQGSLSNAPFPFHLPLKSRGLRWSTACNFTSTAPGSIRSSRNRHPSSIRRPKRRCMRLRSARRPMSTRRLLPPGAPSKPGRDDARRASGPAAEDRRGLSDALRGDGRNDFARDGRAAGPFQSRAGRERSRPYRRNDEDFEGFSSSSVR